MYVLTNSPSLPQEPCDREMVVYHLDDSMPLTPVGKTNTRSIPSCFHTHILTFPHTMPEEVPDSFFEHTVTDLHIMHSDLKKQA